MRTTKPRRLTRLVAALALGAAVLPAAATATLTATAQSAAADVQAGYWGLSPSSGSTFNGNDFRFRAVLAAPVINDDLVVDWGDGTKDNVSDVTCRRVDGKDVDGSQCSIALPIDGGLVDVPDGYTYVTPSHYYTVKGTYHPKITLNHMFSASWTVNAPGEQGDIYVPASDSAAGVTVSPAPIRDDGVVDYHGRPMRKLWYPTGSHVTLSAHGEKAGNWFTWGCYAGCLNGSANEAESAQQLTTDGNPSLTVTVPVASAFDKIGNIGYDSVRGWDFLGRRHDYEQFDATDNLVTNPGFNQPALNAGGWGIFPGNGTAVPGWRSDYGNNIEVDNTGDTLGTGHQYVELDADKPTDMYTTVPVVAGARYRISFEYAGRPGQDAQTNAMNMTTTIGSLPTSNPRILWLQDDATGVGSRQWKTWTGVVTASATNPNAKLDFADAMQTPDGMGMQIDNVRVQQVG